jgi:excisionase family DNA binding protein
MKSAYNFQNPLAKPDPVTPCLAMRPREAAVALGISERLLWEWTNRGEIPHVRIGKAILYPVDVLRRWLDEHAAKMTGASHNADIDGNGSRAEHIQDCAMASPGVNCERDGTDARARGVGRLLSLNRQS